MDFDSRELESTMGSVTRQQRAGVVAGVERKHKNKAERMRSGREDERRCATPDTDTLSPARPHFLHFPGCTTPWGSSVKIPRAMGDFSCLNHHTVIFYMEAFPAGVHLPSLKFPFIHFMFDQVRDK